MLLSVTADAHAVFLTAAANAGDRTLTGGGNTGGGTSAGAGAGAGAGEVAGASGASQIRRRPSSFDGGAANGDLAPVDESMGAEALVKRVRSLQASYRRMLERAVAAEADAAASRGPPADAAAALYH